MANNDNGISRPIDAFVKHFLDIKPYHTKILEVVERYRFAEDMTVTIADKSSLEIQIANDPLCKPVGFGLVFDDSCGYSSVSCCDLFDCVGGYGLVYDNSDLLVSTPVLDANLDEDWILVHGNQTYDVKAPILTASQNTFTVSGDLTSYLAIHNIVLVSPFNIYPILGFTSTYFIVAGNHELEFNTKREFAAFGTASNDRPYAVQKATYVIDKGWTEIIVSSESSAPLTGTSAALGFLETYAPAQNMGAYMVESYNYSNGKTEITVQIDYNLIAAGTGGAIQLRTGLSNGRHVWLRDDTDLETGEREHKIIASEYDLDANVTRLTMVERLNVENQGTVEAPDWGNVKLYGYLSPAGFDNVDECTTPKAYNINVNFSESLTISIIPYPTPTPTPSVTASITPTPTPTMSVTPTPTPSAGGEEFFGFGEQKISDSLPYFAVGSVAPDSVPAFSPLPLDVEQIVLPGYTFSSIRNIEKIGNRLFALYNSTNASRVALRVYNLDEAGTAITSTSRMVTHSDYSTSAYDVMARTDDGHLVVAGVWTWDIWENWGAPSKGVAVLSFDEETDKFTTVAFNLSEEFGTSTSVNFTAIGTGGENIFVNYLTSIYWFKLEGSSLRLVDTYASGALTSIVVKGDYVITNTQVLKIVGAKLEQVATIPTFHIGQTAPYSVVVTDGMYFFFVSGFNGSVIGAQYNTITDDWDDDTTLVPGTNLTGLVAFSEDTQRLYCTYRSFFGGASDHSGIYQWDAEARTLTALTNVFRPQGTDHTIYGSAGLSDVFKVFSDELIPITVTPSVTPTLTPNASATPTPTPSSTTLGITTYQEQVIQDNPVHYWTFDEDDVLQQGWGGDLFITYDTINRMALGFTRLISLGSGITNGYAVGGTSSLILDDSHMFMFDKLHIIDRDAGMTQECWFFPYSMPANTTSGTKVNRLFGGASNGNTNFANPADFAVDLVTRPSPGTRDLEIYFASNYAGRTTVASVAIDYEDWNHLVVTLDTDGYYRVYLNADLIYTASVPITRYNYMNNAQFFPEDGSTLRNPTYFRPYVDEYAIYDYPLTAQQITNHYTLGTAQKVVNYRRSEESEAFSHTVTDTSSMYDNAMAVSKDGKYFFSTRRGAGVKVTVLDIRERNELTNEWTLIDSVDFAAYIDSFESMNCSEDGSTIVAFCSSITNSSIRSIIYIKETAGVWAFEQEIYPVTHTSDYVPLSADGLTFATVECTADCTSGSPSTVAPTNTVSFKIYELSAGTFSLTHTVPVVLDKKWLGTSYSQAVVDHLQINAAGTEIVFATPTNNKPERLHAIAKSAGVWSYTQSFSMTAMDTGFNGVQTIGLGDGTFQENNQKTIAFSDDGQYLVTLAANNTSMTIIDGYHVLRNSDSIMIFKKVGGVWEPYQHIIDPGMHDSDGVHAETLAGYGTSTEYSCLDFCGTRISVTMAAPGYRAIGDYPVLILEFIDDLWQIVDIITPTRTGTNQSGFGEIHRLTNNGNTLMTISFAEGYPTSTISIHDPNPDWYFDNYRGFGRSVELPISYDGYDYDAKVDSYAIGPLYLGENLLKPLHHFKFATTNDPYDRIGSIDGTLLGVAGATTINNAGFVGGSLKLNGKSPAGFLLDTPIDLPEVFTAEFWIKPGPKTGDYRTILGKDRAFSIQLEPEVNKIVFTDLSTADYTTSDGFTTGTTNSYEITENAWTYVLIKNHMGSVSGVERVVRSAHANELASVYVNGRYIGDFVIDPLDRQFTHIGSNADGQVFNGEIAEVAIYNYNISKSDARNRYVGAIANLDITQTPLPTPTRTPTITPTISVTPSVTRSPTPTPTQTRSPTPTPSTGASVTPTNTVTPSVTRSPTPTPTISTTPSLTPSPTATVSVTPSVSPSAELIGTYFQTVMLKDPLHYWTLAENEDDFYDFGRYETVYGTNNTLIGLGVLHRGSGHINNQSVEVISKKPTLTTPNQINTTYALSQTFPWTIELWVFPYTSSAARRPLFVATGGGETLSNNYLNLVDNTVRVLGVDATSTASTAVVANNQWNHVVVTCAGTGLGGLKYYVNGALAATETASSTSVNLNTIGYDGTNTFEGLFDEIAFYDKVLSGAEVLENYNSGVANDVAPTPTPTPTISVTPSVTRTPTPTPTVTPTMTATSTVTPTPTVTTSPSVGASPTPTPSPSPSSVYTPEEIYTNFVLASNPIHYWKFSELAGGTTVVDEVGSNDLIVFDDSPAGDNVTIEAGGIGNGAHINTDYDYNYNRGFNLTSAISTTTLTSGYSHTAWLKLEEPPAGYSYYACIMGADSGQGFEMWMDADSDIFEFYFYGDPPGYVDLPAQWGTWVHVAHVVNPDASWAMYLNGTEVLTGDAAIALNWTQVFTDENYEMMQGTGDEVALYNRPLTPTEIEDQYNAGLDYFAS